MDCQKAATTQPTPKGQMTKKWERMYSVAELSVLWNVSGSTIRRVFGDCKGVMRLGRVVAPPRGTRRYRKLLIPESVATEQFHLRLTK